MSDLSDDVKYKVPERDIDIKETAFEAVSTFEKVQAENRGLVRPGPTEALVSRQGIAAFVTDDDSARALRLGLESLGDKLVIETGDVRTAIAVLSKTNALPSVIVDVSGIENPRAALDDLARVCPPDVKVYAVGDCGDIAFYRLLVQKLGVTEYLVKPLTRDSVQQLLLPHLTGRPLFEQEESRGGQVVAVCGARGGVGTSSIALSLAYELTDVVKGHVALLDLHIQNGEIALMLGQRPGAGLRMALESGSEIDHLFLDRVAIDLEPRLKLIASQEAWNTPATVNEKSLVRLIELLQRKFNYIVADIPMPTPPALEPVLKIARQVIVVLNPDLASIRDTVNIREYVHQVSGTDKVITLLNRFDTSGHVDPAMIDRTLGKDVDVRIPELGGPMLEAINLGVAASRHVPALHRHLAPLVREISGVAPKTGLHLWPFRWPGHGKD